MKICFSIKSRVRSYTLILLLGVLSNLFAYEIKPINLDKNGRMGYTVNAILKDSKGFMWFGSYDGLMKYDGYKTISYLHNQQNEIKSDVRNIKEDQNGNLIIGTNGNGVFIFYPDSK